MRSYQDFYNRVDDIIDKSRTLADFYRNLKEDTKAKELKRLVREELQDAYRKIAVDYRLKRIPVYLSDKYKIRVGGQTHYKKFSGSPKGIVIFYLRAPRFIRFEEELPATFRVTGEADIVDTFFHEVAHVVDLKMRGTSAHDRRFYDIIEELEGRYRKLLIERREGEMFSELLESLMDDMDEYTKIKLERIQNEFEYAMENPDYISVAKKKIRRELKTAEENLELGFDDAQLVIDKANEYLKKLKEKEKGLKESADEKLWIVDIYGLTDSMPFFKKYTRASSPDKALSNTIFKLVKEFEKQKNLVYYKDDKFSVPITREKAGVLIKYLQENPNRWKATKLGEEINVKEV